jgi:Fur family transcriptional regulator, ferric uptake regulator
MCHQCDYPRMLSQAGLRSTSHRLRVLEIIGNNTTPLSAKEIFTTVHRHQAIDQVTVYRILDNLVEKGLVERISGGRAYFFGLAPNAFHQRHPHFYCRQCGQINCLNPESITMDLHAFQRIFPGQIDNVEVRLDGICKRCLASAEM